MFSSCLCVCVSVCMSVCVPVCLVLEWVDIETSFLVWCYILTISRSSLSIKVIGSMSRSSHGKCFNLIWLVQGQGHKLDQGHLKVKVILKSNWKCLTFYWQAGGGPSTERHSCFVNSFCFPFSSTRMKCIERLPAVR